MANAVRVENLSNAEQELAPGTGFIPAKGHADFPIATYRDKHERYARARLEADPPVFKVTEVDSPDIDKQARIDALAAEDEQRAAATRQAELGRKIEETVQKSGVAAGPSTSGVDGGTSGLVGAGAAVTSAASSGVTPNDDLRKADEERRRQEQRKAEELQKQQTESGQKRGK